MSDLYPSPARSWILSSPPGEWLLKQARELVIGALRQGPIPQHVAFIMDGNRRYAKNHKIETIEGHNHGFEALARVLEICYKTGVKVVTVYAFSIENFNRPKYEVEGLMQLAKAKLEQLAQHGDILDRYGARIQVLGQRNLIRPDVLEHVDRAVEITKKNNKAVLNICFPYTSREEITTAIRSTVEEYSGPPKPQNTPFSQTRISRKLMSKQQGSADFSLTAGPESPTPSAKSDVDDTASTSTTLQPGSPQLHAHAQGGVAIVQNPESITASTIEDHLYTAGCPPLDLFIRTSGVTRLSDFLMWQSHENTHIAFTDCYWPEFDLWHFMPILIEWQWRQKEKAREERPTRLRRLGKTRTM